MTWLVFIIAFATTAFVGLAAALRSLGYQVGADEEES